jgi:HK97 family phage portal protein
VRFFGFELTRKKDGALSAVPSYGAGRGGFFGIIRESFSGAWQRNVEVDCQESILAFSAVYGCVSLIADDVSKLRIKLVQSMGAFWQEISSPAFSPVLAKPNRYQTRIQFIKEWITMKLLHGNAYIYLERDQRQVVIAMYVLDSRRVKPLVSTDGSVYYQVNRYDLAGVADDQPIVEASEIIHDRMITLWHPLVGVTPIYACGAAATQGSRIQANSAKFFENMSRPSGQLTAPGEISEPTAERLKKEFEGRFGGENVGRIFVGGDGLKFEPITIPANDAQLIEQLRWTVEDVCRCFHVPLHKLQSGANPTFNNVSAMNQDYYTQCLQIHIESIELLLDEALGLPAKNYGTELDLDGLLRMDPAGRALTYKDAIGAGYLRPNEARAKEDLPPIDGGDEAWMQQQNWPISQLARRSDAALEAPKPTPAAATPDSAPAQLPPPPAKELDAERALKALIAKFNEASIEELVDA